MNILRKAVIGGALVGVPSKGRPEAHEGHGSGIDELKKKHPSGEGKYTAEEL